MCISSPSIPPPPAPPPPAPAAPEEVATEVDRPLQKAGRKKKARGLKSLTIPVPPVGV